MTPGRYTVNCNLSSGGFSMLGPCAEYFGAPLRSRKWKIAIRPPCSKSRTYICSRLKVTPDAEFYTNSYTFFSNTLSFSCMHHNPLHKYHSCTHHRPTAKYNGPLLLNLNEKKILQNRVTSLVFLRPNCENLVVSKNGLGENILFGFLWVFWKFGRILA